MVVQKNRRKMAGSSIYWNSVDSQRSSGGSSGDAGSGNSRHYVDPWDLENYAYYRRHSIATPAYQPTSYSRLGHSRLSYHSRAESDYWYAPRREPGYDSPASIEELYFRPPRPPSSACYYHQPIYEDEMSHYAAPFPVYSRLSELEALEEHRMRELLKRRNKSSRARSLPKEDCLYHRALSDISVAPRRTRHNDVDNKRYLEVISPSQLSLNTYGYLKIDYSNSWNSLHRKISK